MKLKSRVDVVELTAVTVTVAESSWKMGKWGLSARERRSLTRTTMAKPVKAAEIIRQRWQRIDFANGGMWRRRWWLFVAVTVLELRGSAMGFCR